MKKIDIDDELYHYIASNTQSIGESASTILRRLLNFNGEDLIATSINTVQRSQDTAPTKSVLDPTQTKKIDESEKTTVAISPEVTIHNNDVTERELVKGGNVFNVLNKEELAMQKGVVGRFLFILSAFHRTHKDDFSHVLDIKGRDRVYFATSKEDLINSGSSMNPKNITDSEYWVMTNSNTTRKKMMLHEVALCLGYTPEQAEDIRDYL